MKFIDILYEIGEGSLETYDAEILEKGMSSRYTFFTENQTEYIVEFKKLRSGNVEVSFFVPSNKNIWKMTGEGEPIKIINTVLNVFEDYHKKYHERVDKYIFYPESENDEDKNKLPKRGRILKRAIKKRYPKAKIKTNIDNVIIKINENYNEI